MFDILTGSKQAFARVGAAFSFSLFPQDQAEPSSVEPSYRILAGGGEAKVTSSWCLP